MENGLLELLKKHCPEKSCPLAGSSIHVDREVVRLRMPSVFNHLHYRIIDVSSFYEVVQRWLTPERWIEQERYIENVMNEKYRNNAGKTHRAIYDVERSIELLKLFKPCIAMF